MDRVTDVATDELGRAVVAVDEGRALSVRMRTMRRTGLDQIIHLVLRSESNSFGIAVVRYWAWGVGEMVHLH
ncbi:MAG: hypothetical protein KGL79_08650 [Acidobacteriota bacterium]|nr:hypothetical protein [Acidobacteriota bacterium]